MGIPKQVIEAEQESEKELTGTVEQQPPKADVVDSVPVEEKPKETQAAEVKLPEQAHTEAKPTEDVAKPPPNVGKSLLSRLGSEISKEKLAEEADIRYRALNGKFCKSERAREALSLLNEKQQQEIEKLKQEIEELRNQNPTNDIEALRKQLGGDMADEEVQRFASAVDARVSRQTRDIQKRLEDIETERREEASRAAKSKVDKFSADLEKDFPGFRNLDANNDERWLSFLNSSPGGVEGISYGDIAKDALSNLDYRKFASIVRVFAKNAGIVFTPNGKPSNGSEMADLRPSSTGDARSTQNQPRIFPRSEIEHFRKAYFARRAEKRFGLTSQQVQEILRIYEDAESDGRVAENL